MQVKEFPMLKASLLKWSHVFREGNQSLDLLAKHNHNLHADFQLFDFVPDFLQLVVIVTIVYPHTKSLKNDDLVSVPSSPKLQIKKIS
ncbi:hypothetical protein CR513_39725, partial [Mucuna pruriens]